MNVIKHFISIQNFFSGTTKRVWKVLLNSLRIILIFLLGVDKAYFKAHIFHPICLDIKIKA